jgi:ABC-type sulfate/molybdate transport systems ATPase subunit
LRVQPRAVRKDEAGIRARVKELLDLVQLDWLSGRYPAQLSGGQRQRVCLMRALMLSPELLLLDEPLGALDPLVRSALQKDLREIFAQLQQSAILVTHDMAEAAFLGDEIVLMNEGRIVQRGSIVDLREKPANNFVTEFLNAQRSLAVL